MNPVNFVISILSFLTSYYPIITSTYKALHSSVNKNEVHKMLGLRIAEI